MCDSITIRIVVLRHSFPGGVYPNQAGQAFAIFKFVQCVAAAAGFVYAGYIPLYWHILMLGIVGLFGTFFFVKIDIQARKNENGKFRIMEPKDGKSAPYGQEFVVEDMAMRRSSFLMRKKLLRHNI